MPSDTYQKNFNMDYKIFNKITWNLLKNIKQKRFFSTKLLKALRWLWLLLAMSTANTEINLNLNFHSHEKSIYFYSYIDNKGIFFLLPS